MLVGLRIQSVCFYESSKFDFHIMRHGFGVTNVSLCYPGETFRVRWLALKSDKVHVEAHIWQKQNNKKAFKKSQNLFFSEYDVIWRTLKPKITVKKAFYEEKLLRVQIHKITQTFRISTWYVDLVTGGANLRWYSGPSTFGKSLDFRQKLLIS